MPILVCWSTTFHQLWSFDKFEIHVLIYTLLLWIYVQLDWSLVDVKISIFVKKVLSRSWLSILTAIYQQRHVVVLYIGKKLEHFFESLWTVLLIWEFSWLQENPLGVADVAGSWSSCIVSVNSIPSLLENALYLFQSVKGRHLLSWRLFLNRSWVLICLLDFGRWLRACWLLIRFHCHVLNLKLVLLLSCIVSLNLLVPSLLLWSVFWTTTHLCFTLNYYYNIIGF